MVSIGFGFFELYGLKPLAGRFFARAQGADAIPNNPSPDMHANYVINQAAVRQLGLGSPEAAIGKTISFISASQAYGLPPGPMPGLRGTVIGVVRDFSIAPTDTAIEPTAYSVGQAVITNKQQAGLLHVKLRGVAIPEALAALDGLWQRVGNGDPIDRTFVDAYVQKQEIAVLREAGAFAVFAGIAMFLACLGLFGVSLSTTERRTKEIGIRKAMGATSGDILALLLWQFSKPVLWANLIAWPLAWWLMQYWLAGFAYHISLDVWPFLAAGTATLAIALLTVAGQATMVALQKPVHALRYE
jgi:putative ABC transport system permease protein